MNLLRRLSPEPQVAGTGMRYGGQVKRVKRKKPKDECGDGRVGKLPLGTCLKVSFPMTLSIYPLAH